MAEPFTSEREVVRLAATADLHHSRSSQGQVQRFFADVGQSADVLLLCGDLTDYGLPECFVEGFLNEEFDHFFSPRAERAPAEAAGESLDPCEANPLHLTGVSVQHAHTGIGQNLQDVGLFARLVVVVTEDGHDGDIYRGGQLPRQKLRLFGL